MKNMNTAWAQQLVHHDGIAGPDARRPGKRFIGKGPRVQALGLAFIGVLSVLASPTAVAQTSSPHLTPEQEAIARRLDQTFIAPCCFTNTLAEHRSPVAEELRQEIRAILAGGATETQVVDAFVAKYGERILAAPKPQGFNLLAYVLPAVAVAVGLLIFAVFMRRRGPHPPNATAPSKIPDQVKARFEAELAHFDE